MSFLDTFQGYHQIPLALDVQNKTIFVTSSGNCHYKVMPFGLKNTGSTYQRMMTRMFESQLGKNIKIYRDGMVVKSKLESEHINDLENIFVILKRHKLRLMLPSALLVLDQEISWGTWLPITELKSTLTKLKQLITYSHFRIPKRSRS